MTEAGKYFVAQTIDWVIALNVQAAIAFVFASSAPNHDIVYRCILLSVTTHLFPSEQMFYFVSFFSMNINKVQLNSMGKQKKNKASKTGAARMDVATVGSSAEVGDLQFAEPKKKPVHGTARFCWTNNCSSRGKLERKKWRC